MAPVDVAGDYRYYLDLIRRGRWTIGASVIVCLGLAVLSGFLRTPLYRAQATVSVELPAAPADPAQTVMAPQYNSYFDYEYYFQTQLRVIASTNLALRAAERLLRLPSYLGRTKEDLAAEIQASVAPHQIENTRIIAIAVTRESPEEAALWANTLAEVYVEGNLEERRKSFQETIAALRAVVERAEANQAEAIERLQRASRTLGFVPVEGAEGRWDTSALEAARQALVRAEQERQQAEARYQRALAVRDAPHRLVAVLSEPNELSGLLQRKAVLEQELHEMARRGLLDRNPRVVARRAELVALEQQIARATEAALEALRHGVEVARRREGEARRARDLEQQRVQSASTDPKLLDRALQQTIAAEITREVKQALNRVELSSQLLRNNVAIVDRAVPPRIPLNRQSPRVLVLGVLGGIVLGVGIVLARDIINNTIRDPEEIERLMGLPDLGEIPRFSEDEEFARREAFHALWTNLRLALRGVDSPAILITSAVGEEGKTTIACEVARTAASLGARTVLVDLDLRRPAAHHRFPILARPHSLSGAILVVDDEAAVRRMIAHGLAARSPDGAAVGPILMAENGPEALQKIRENEVAVALVDIKLPGMNGVEVVGKIKELSPHTEVILITGYASLETAIEAVRRGAVDYLTKPFGVEALREAVERALQRWRQHTPSGVSSILPESEGVVAYLAGEAELSTLLCRTDIPNLHVLPAGRPPHNPFLLLDRTALHEMIRMLKTQFEWIICDSPPVMAVSDPTVIAPVMDGVLFVVRYDRTDRRLVRKAVRGLARANERIVGVVLNDIRAGRGQYYYRYEYRPLEEGLGRRHFLSRSMKKILSVRRGS